MTIKKLKDEARKEFDVNYRNSYIWEDAENNKNSVSNSIKDFIDSLITKAYEEGKKANI